MKSLAGDIMEKEPFTNLQGFEIIENQMLLKKLLRTFMRCTQLIQPHNNLELIGQIGERRIFYCNVRLLPKWFDKITFDNWIAFTIADHDDKALLSDITKNCLDKGVCYTCSGGQLASLTEDYFDEEIVWRQVQQEEKTGKPSDHENVPMTSYHTNFSEGLWFAATNANQIINDVYVLSKEVICIDCTKYKVRTHLLNLIEKIKSGWLPSDDEIEKPVFDER